MCNPKFPLTTSSSFSCLQLTGLLDLGLLAVLDGTAAGASSFKSLDDVKGLFISDLTEDNVAAVEPRGDDGGDEELGAVAVTVSISAIKAKRLRRCLRVGAGVGHGKQTRLVVLQGEVLVSELLTVDGLATSALGYVSSC